MTQFTLYALVSVSLFCLGLAGLIVHDHLLRKILAFNIMGVGIFLFLVNVAHRDPALSPDPVPQAMVLTGIVVAVSATAFALALARRIAAATGQTHLADMDEDA